MRISKVQYEKYFLKVVLLCTWVLCFCRILLQQYECSFWPNKCRPAESITQYKDTSKQTMQEKFQDKLWLIFVWAPMWFKDIWMLLCFQYMCSKNFHICQNMATMWVPYSYRSVILVYNLLPNFPLICLQNYFFLTTQTNPEWMFWPPLFDKRPSISPLLCSPDIFTFHPRYGIVPHISYFCISTFSCFQIFICQWVLILACPTYLC